jgi:5'-nucleotidase (lipoprotein e(P4) family)
VTLAVPGRDAGPASRAWRRSAWAPACAGALLAGCATVPSAEPPVAATPMAATVAPPPAAVTPGSVPPGMQYLYGSGEGAAISIQAWRGLVGYAAARAKARPTDSVVLASGATLDAPRFVPCGAKPLAAVFDVDETVLLNLGFEADDAAHPGRSYDQARWQAWERTGVAQVSPVPGAREALATLRAMGVTPVFNTNRSVGTVEQTAASLNGAGLGPARHGETLFVAGDDPTGSRKDLRRVTIAARYCVIAMGGDQLGDFSDLFNAGQPVRARRDAVAAPALALLWGAGWFVLPNPVYGSALKGGLDDVFPADKRWNSPGAAQ